jgi:hypothetical protein
VSALNAELFHGVDYRIDRSRYRIEEQRCRNRQEPYLQMFLRTLIPNSPQVEEPGPDRIEMESEMQFNLQIEKAFSDLPFF